MEQVPLPPTKVVHLLQIKVHLNSAILPISKSRQNKGLMKLRTVRQKANMKWNPPLFHCSRISFLESRHQSKTRVSKAHLCLPKRRILSSLLTSASVIKLRSCTASVAKDLYVAYALLPITIKISTQTFVKVYQGTCPRFRWKLLGIFQESLTE